MKSKKPIDQYDVTVTQTVTFEFEVRVVDCYSASDAEWRAQEAVNRWGMGVGDVDDCCDYDSQCWEAESARPVTNKRKKLTVIRLDEEFLS